MALARIIHASGTNGPNDDAPGERNPKVEHVPELRVIHPSRR